MDRNKQTIARNFRDRRARARREQLVPTAFEKRDKERRKYKRRANILGLEEKNWEKTDDRVIGWFCTYTPEEIFYAAGLTPMRIIPDSVSVSHSYSCMPSNLCPYVVNSLDTAIYFKDKFLKAAVIVNSCDAMRKMYDAWQHYMDTPFVYFLDLPKTVTKESKKYFRKCLLDLIRAIEKHYDVKITEDSLQNAINVCNETRMLLRNLYELRKRDVPALTGSEILNIVKASMTYPKEIFNNHLKSFMKEIEARKIEELADKPRILLMGSYFDNESLLHIIENYGGNVVCDQMCNGVTYFHNEVDVNKEPVDAITERYMEKVPCARMLTGDKRSEYVLNLVRENSIGGIIYYTLKFCDSNLFSFPRLKEVLNEKNIPVLFLESDGTSSNLGQLKTRVQTFVDLLQIRR